MFEFVHSHSEFSTTTVLGCSLTLEVANGKEPDYAHDEDVHCRDS